MSTPRLDKGAELGERNMLGSRKCFDVVVSRVVVLVGNLCDMSNVNFCSAHIRQGSGPHAH